MTVRRRRISRLVGITPLRLFAVSCGAGLVILFGGYTALLLILTEPVEIRMGPLNEAMLTAGALLQRNNIAAFDYTQRF